MAKGRSRAHAIDWPAVVLAAGLTAALTVCAGLSGAALNSPTVAVVLALAAIFGAGMLTVRLRPWARALEPGIGAGLLLLVLGIVQVSMGGRPAEATLVQLVSALVVTASIAFFLGWAGGRAAAKLPPGRHGRTLRTY